MKTSNNSKTLIAVLALLSLLAISAIPAMASFTHTTPADITAPGDATVNVAHFAPFAAGVDNTSVSVYLNGEEAIPNFKFGDITAGVELPIGDYLVEIIPTGSSTAAISDTFTLAADTQYTLAALGDGTNQTLELAALVDETLPLTDSAKLRIAHMAPWTTGDALVDVCVDGSTTPLLPNLAYKDFTNPYLTLAPGNYDLLIAVAGTSCGTVALDIPSVTLVAGEIVDVFAIGGANGYDLQIASVTGFNLTTATVNVAHFAPFAAGVDNTSVSVYLNGEEAIPNFKFGDITAGVELPIGDYLVEIIPTGSSTAAISDTFTLDDIQYTLAALGDGTNQILELAALVDETLPLTDSAKLRIAHMAPWTTGDALVDVCVDGSTTPLLPNLAYKDFTNPYLTLAPGNYDLLIAVAGTSCGTVALDIPSVTLVAGEIVDVFAIGGANGYDLQIASVTGFNLTTATVNVAHFAPFAAGVDNTSVSVYLNGEEAIPNFKFGDITAGVELPIGDYLVEIIPTGSSTAAISDTFTLDDMQYTLAALGDGTNQTLELAALVDETLPLTDSAKLRIAHMAPWTTGDALVDVCVDGSTTPLLPNLAYKDFTNPYLTLAPGNYDLLIAVAGTSCGTVALDIPSVTLVAGEIVDVFAIGGANGYDLQIASVTGFNLTTFVYFPVIYR